MERLGGRNWIQRHIIQQELDRRGSQQSEHPVDPLARVKQYYYEMFTKETGTPGVSEDSSPIYARAASNISTLVDFAADSANQFYTDQRAVVRRTFPPGFEADADQCLNEVMVEMAHANEKILELTVQFMAHGDPLSSSNVGKLIRRVIPNPRQVAIQRASFSIDTKIKQIITRYRRDIERRKRRGISMKHD